MAAVPNYKNSQVYAAIDALKSPSKPVKEKASLPVIAVLTSPDDSYRIRNNEDTGETLQVSSTGELIVAPDVCTFNICVSSKKERAQDVKNSVARRFDYVLQTLHNHQIKKNEMTTNESLQRINEGGSELFSMESQVTVCIRDLTKYQPINNLLTEKLDSHVMVSVPDFSHDLGTLEQARRQASLLAIKNCKGKAAEIAQVVGCRLGPVVAVREDSCNQWTDDSYAAVDGRDVRQPMTVQQRIKLATVHVATKLTVVFELRSAHKAKQRKL